jgi:predicted O-linked N-acetylglucosamine transferase (SPINDLY family)
MNSSNSASQKLTPLLRSVEQLIQNNKLSEAADQLNALGKIAPEDPRLYLLASLMAQASQNPLGMLAAAEKAMSLAPGWCVATIQAASASALAFRPAQALSFAEQAEQEALSTQSADSALYSRLAGVAIQAQAYPRAVQWAQRALALSPDQVNLTHQLGEAFAYNGQFEKAIASYSQALNVSPNTPNILLDRMLAYLNNQQNDLALLDAQLLVKLEPHNPIYIKHLEQLSQGASEQLNEGHQLFTQGLEHQNQLKWDLAIECYDQAIEANPHLTEAYVNKGTALLRKNKPIDALSCYEQALLLNPNDADIYCNAGNALLQLKQPLSAVANFDTAIRLQPDFAQVIYNRGNAYLSLKNLTKALSDFDRALELQPDIDFLQGMRLQTMMGLCKWETLNEDIQTAKKSAQLGLKTLIPFSSLAFEDDPKSLQQIASTYANALYPFNDCLGPLPKFKSKKKIKLAYFSMDFHSHPVSHLIVEVLEKHDRSQFEVIAFSFGPVTGDTVQERIKQAVDEFIDVRELSDVEIAKLARKMKVDIAIDLGGYTENCRTGIFACRAAPVQINYLGFLGTMGSEYMDYIIADSVLIPENDQIFYNEKIIYLPHYQPNDSTTLISESEVKRSDYSLPADAVVYCCFNNAIKITPIIFDSWMHILLHVPNSVLWLYAEDPMVIKNLKDRASAVNILPDRIIFAEHESLSSHLERQKLADIFLDTYPFNAGATANAALWSELPILTLIGKSFANRYAASILSTMDMQELVVDSLNDYEKQAIHLGQKPTLISSLKDKIKVRKLKSTLFNTELYVGSLENAFKQVIDKMCKDKPYSHVYVKN